VNEAFAKHYGRTAEKFIGFPIQKFVKSESQNAFFEKAKLLTYQSPKLSLVSERQDSEGSSILIDWATVALFDEQQNLVGYQTVGRDVTLLMQSNADLEIRNQELNLVRNQLRVIMDAIPSKIFYKDDKNNILRINKAGADSLGMKVEDIEGQSTYDLFGDVAKSYHEDDLTVINSGEAMLGYEERYAPAEGPAGWVRTDKIPFDDSITGDKHIIAIVTDITEQKEREALLETVNRNLDDFAALTSHDLQAPLRHVALFSELLEAELGEDISPLAVKYTSEIRQSADNMRNIILTFLKFMRASPDKTEFEIIRFSDKLKEVVNEYRSEIDALGGEISATDSQIWARGDENLLGQVLRNLISNAIKYRHPDRPPLIDVSAIQKHGLWKIIVSDNGRGVNDNEYESIFNLYNRSKMHNHEEGTGIGLALSKRFITLHGGDISAHRNNIGGTDFVFTLNAVGQA
jgi:PAS domain S-box-containing protein